VNNEGKILYILCTFSALRKGGRWPWLWLATVGHGLVVEAVSYNLPDIDNFWHSQTPIIFLGGRFPLHIIFLCTYTKIFFLPFYQLLGFQDRLQVIKLTNAQVCITEAGPGMQPNCQIREKMTDLFCMVFLQIPSSFTRHHMPYLVSDFLDGQNPSQ